MFAIHHLTHGVLLNQFSSCSLMEGKSLFCDLSRSPFPSRLIHLASSTRCSPQALMWFKLACSLASSRFPFNISAGKVRKREAMAPSSSTLPLFEDSQPSRSYLFRKDWQNLTGDFLPLQKGGREESKLIWKGIDVKAKVSQGSKYEGGNGKFFKRKVLRFYLL